MTRKSLFSPAVTARLLFLAVISVGRVLVASSIVEHEVSVERTTVSYNIDDECGIWMAPSTIPGSGMGMFASKHFKNGTQLFESGEVVIPIVDIGLHHDEEGRRDYNFLWDDYIWDGDTLQMDDEGYSVSGASPGFGAAANSFLDLVNVDEDTPRKDEDNPTTPGAGAYSPYHNRISTARGDIEPGQEFFVSYGPAWFTHRVKDMGEIPLEGHHEKAERVLEKYHVLENRYKHTMPKVMDGLLQRFIFDAPVKTFITNAFPTNRKDLYSAKQLGLVGFKRQQATVSIDFLHEYGTCADNLKAGPSTLVDAGRGAFATRFIPKGAVVAPIPTLHLLNGTTYMEMYELSASGDHKVVNHTVRAQQLLINYCYGHPNSTLLFSPYGSFTNFVNHNQTLQNVEIQWGDPKRTSNQPQYMNWTLNDLLQQKSAIFAFQFVATTDVYEGEEIFMDYGDAWERAWDHHVSTWTPQIQGPPPEGMNKNESLVLMTKTEQLRTPYDLKLKCHSDFLLEDWKQHKSHLSEYLNTSKTNRLTDCELILRHEEGKEITYTAIIYAKDGKTKKVWDLPRQAFWFVRAKGAMHATNAFRHAIHLPDSLFPEHWKDVAPSSDQ